MKEKVRGCIVLRKREYILLRTGLSLMVVLCKAYNNCKKTANFLYAVEPDGLDEETYI